MPKVVFVHPNRHEITLEARIGSSVMQAAVSNNVEGIVGECGGSAMCATCHVYVDEAYFDKLPAIGDTEDAMLESTASERCCNSRLGCQIRITDELDGIRIYLPQSQV